MEDIVELDCKVQHYDWGRKGGESIIFHLLGEGKVEEGREGEEEKAYAELWMGTHPNGPSLVKHSQQTLQEWICGNEKDSTRKVGGNLPFLFKVLSIRIPLSIQAHPDKELAKKLHKEQPNIYKDANHKPELVLALSDDFEALCSFLPFGDVIDNINHTPELKEILGDDLMTSISSLPSPLDDVTARSIVKQIFQCLMFAPPSLILLQTSSLISRLSSSLFDINNNNNNNNNNKDQVDEKEEKRKEVGRAVLRANKEFPNDVGLFCFYLLNYVKLKRGEGLFMGANEPHAYLQGNCLEVQACSDNVVRAGLTPKHRDSSTLCSMLTYHLGPSPILLGHPVDQFTKLYYNPSIDDFSLFSITLPENSSYSPSPRDTPFIFIVTSGKGELKVEVGQADQSNLSPRPISFGSIFYVIPNSVISFTSFDPLEIFACSCQYL